MSFKRNLFQNMLVSGGYNYATQALVFFSTVITSRLLAPESFGFVGLILVFTGFVSVFSDSGISLAVIRSDYKATYHRSVDNLAVLLGFALGLITCLLAYPIALFYGKPQLFLPTITMSLLFLLKSLSLVRGALLAKELKFGTIGKGTLLTAILQVLITVGMAYANCGYWSLIIPQLVAAFFLVLYYERAVQLGFKRCSIPQLKVAYQHTRKTIGNLMGFNLVNYWARNLDNLLVGKFYGITDLGIYNRAYNLLMMPLGLITGLVGSVLFPSLKKLKSQGGDVHGEYLFILKMITIATLPVCFVLIVFPEPFVLMLWGKNWIAVSRLLPYFGLLVFSQSLLSTTGNMLVLLEKEAVMRISGWVSAVATIAAIVYGTFISLDAIAQFYSLAFILVVLPFNLYYLFIRTLHFPARDMLLFWMPFICISLFIWLCCFFGNESGKVIGMAALCVVALWHFKAELGQTILELVKGKTLLVRPGLK